VANADLATALKMLAGNLTAYAQLRDYYNGNHRLLFATDKFRETTGGELC
jgi:hypothetical protein